MAASMKINGIGPLRNKDGTNAEQARNKYGTKAKQNIAQAEAGNSKAEP
jgi:hypothetical protein